MARRTYKRKVRVFDSDIIAEEKYYLGNNTLPTKESRYEWTAEMVEALNRCKEDVIYFAENFFTIIDPTDLKRKHIPLRSYQRRFLRTMQKNKRVIMLTSRQCGKTTMMTIYALWLAMFYPNQTIRLVAHAKDRALENLSRVALAYTEMDNWIKQPVEEGAWNKGSIKFANGSSITALATSGSSGRGDTVSCMLLDELGFVEEHIAQEFWRSVGPALSANPNSQMFIASTPNGIGNLLWKLCDDSDKGKSEYIVDRVYWWDIPGRDEAWKQRTLANDCAGDIDYFEQEYECRFLGASQSPFAAKLFERLENEVKEPIETLDDGALKIWQYPQNDRVYSIGVDVAEGLGQDASVIQVFDLTDLSKIEQVATYWNNQIDPIRFTEKILRIAEMYGRPLLSVERNGCGTDLCNRIALDNNYPRFVNHGAGKSYRTQNFRWGIISNQATKSNAVVNMKFWLTDNDRVHIYDKRFVEELRHFTRNKNNKWEAATGYHDDIVMSVAWALNVLHRDLIEDQFIVSARDANNIPIKVYNKFRYSVDEAEYKKLLTVQFGKPEWRMPVIVYGRQTVAERLMPMTEREKAKYQQENGDWLCFANPGTIIDPGWF